jgi:hypothetical protein
MIFNLTLHAVALDLGIENNCDRHDFVLLNGLLAGKGVKFEKKGQKKRANFL